MPIFHLRPRLTSLDDDAWANSPYRGEAWAHAESPAQARELISVCCEGVAHDNPCVTGRLSPWRNPMLVDVLEVSQAPHGMTIPRGVVVADVHEQA